MQYTKKNHGNNTAEALGSRLSFEQAHLSSGQFVSICVHSWFVFIDDWEFLLE